MRTIERRVRINRPPDVVFDRVGDLGCYPEFWVGLGNWEPIGELNNAVGDRVRVLLEVGATHSGGTVRIVEHARPTRLAWESEVGTQHSAEFDIVPDGDGSIVTLRLTVRLSGGSTGRLVERFVSPMVGRIIDATLEGLRDLVEWGHIEPRPAN